MDVNNAEVNSPEMWSASVVQRLLLDPNSIFRRSLEDEREGGEPAERRGLESCAGLPASLGRRDRGHVDEARTLGVFSIRGRTVGLS